MISVRSLTRSGLLVAAGISGGVIFHSLGIGGQVALPLHYPPLLAGFLLNWKWGMMVGLFVPLLSASLTGMPPLLPTALLMVPELMAYGAASALLRKVIGLYPALIVSLILGRIAWGLAVCLLTPLLGLNLPVMAAILGGIVMGLPGIVGQILLVPPIVTHLEKSFSH